ncbi:MAG: hypothetical protein KDD95_10120, partial [Rhodobacteraceae bacterium]|nr:hypothetical protein [Paracoccaceae bacterium]MCB2140581.1 hypothetical protein [Paracoccaceae bacterium]MCB2158792.1 hypothetical protein [Paracoccaceae bacterium]
AAAAEAAKAAEEAAAKAAEEAQKAAEEAAAAAQSAVEEAADAVEGAVQEATEAATGAVEAAGDAAADIGAALDPANFDAEKVKGAIDASTLDDATKSTLKTAVDGAAANPALVQTVVDQVKAALGL